MTLCLVMISYYVYAGQQRCCAVAGIKVHGSVHVRYRLAEAYYAEPLGAVRWNGGQCGSDTVEEPRAVACSAQTHRSLQHVIQLCCIPLVADHRTAAHVVDGHRMANVVVSSMVSQRYPFTSYSGKFVH